MTYLGPHKSCTNFVPVHSERWLPNPRCINCGEWEDEHVHRLATPAQEEQIQQSAPAAEQIAELNFWSAFPGWLIDNCEGETITEEFLQQQAAALHEARRKGEYKCMDASSPAPEKPEIDPEFPTADELIRRGWARVGMLAQEKPVRFSPQREKEIADAAKQNPKLDMVVLPTPDGLDFRNAGQQCDMLAGPCVCGAWHRLEDLPRRIFTQLKAASPAQEKPVASVERRYRVNTGDGIVGISEAQKEKLLDAVFDPLPDQVESSVEERAGYVARHLADCGIIRRDQEQRVANIAKLYIAPATSPSVTPAPAQEEARLFREIMAVMNCDGGHYRAEHGSEAAFAQAVTNWNERYQRMDMAEHQLIEALAALKGKDEWIDGFEDAIEDALNNECTCGSDPEGSCAYCSAITALKTSARKALALQPNSTAKGGK